MLLSGNTDDTFVCAKFFTEINVQQCSAETRRDLAHSSAEISNSLQSGVTLRWMPLGIRMPTSHL